MASGKRLLPLNGLGSLVDMPNYRRSWQDCDKAFPQESGSVQQWPGYQRVWSPSWIGAGYTGDLNLYPNGSRITQVMVGSQQYERQNNGVTLVSVDRQSGATTGVAQFSGGVNGTEWIGTPASYGAFSDNIYTIQDQKALAGDYRVTISSGYLTQLQPIYGKSTGLNDITRAGAYTGRVNKPYWVRITSVGSPNKFVWCQADTMPNTWAALPDPPWSSEINVSTSPTLLSFNVTVQWGATTGHAIGQVWKIPAGFSNGYSVSRDNGLTLVTDTETYPDHSLTFDNTIYFMTKGLQAPFPFIGFKDIRKFANADHEWRFRKGGCPTLANTLNKVEAFEPVSFAANSQGTAYAVPYDRVGIHTGLSDGPAGILPPAIAPVAVGLINEAAQTNIGLVNSGTWTAGADGIDVTTSSTVFARGTQSVKITIPKSQRRGRINLAYVNTGGITVPGTTKRLRLILRADTRRGTINKKIMSIVYSSTTNLGGTVKEIPLNENIDRNKWDEIDLPWTEGAFTIASIGIKLKGSLENDQFTKGHNGTVTLYVGDIYIDAAVPPVSSTFSKGTWQFEVCGMQSATGRLSAPSPASKPVEVNSTGIRIDGAGFFAQMPVGLMNSFPECDGIVVFGSTPDFGQPDPRTGVGAVFYRISPPGGHLFSEIVLNPTAAPDNTGAGTFLGLYASGEVISQVWTLTCTRATDDPSPGDPAQFTVSGSVSGAVDTTFDADGVDVFSFSDSQGGTLSFALQTDTDFADGDTITFNSGPIVSFTDEINVEQLADTNNELDPFFNTLPAPGQLLVPDGDRIVSMMRPSFSVGTSTWTEGSRIVIIAGAYITDWAQDRFIVPAGSSTQYRILKVLSSSLAESKLYVGRFNSGSGIFEDPYDGTTYTGGAYSIISDLTDIRWSNVTERYGVDPQASSPENTLTIMTGGNVITGGGKSGPYLWIFGRDNSFTLQQNTNALDDIPVEGIAYANPYHVPGIGAVSQNAIVPLPNGDLIVMGPRAQLWTVSGNSATKHPGSDVFASVVGGYGALVNTEKMNTAFGSLVYKNGRPQVVFVFQHERPVDSDSIPIMSDDDFYGPGVVGKSADLYTQGDEVVPGFAVTNQSCWQSIPDPVGGVSPLGDPFFIDMEDSFGLGEFCAEAGSAYSAVTYPMFNFALMVDAESGVISAASNVPFTCAQRSVGGISCAPQGQLQGAAYFGDAQGYINFMDDTLLSWGSPFNRFQFSPALRIVRNSEAFLDLSNGFMITPAIYSPTRTGKWSFFVVYDEFHHNWAVNDDDGEWPVRAQTNEFYSQTFNGSTLQFRIYNGDNGNPFVELDGFSFDTYRYVRATDGYSAVLQDAILPIDNNGTGILGGLIISKLSADNSVEYRLIESNSINTITLKSSNGAEKWATAPATTDVYTIGPLDVFIRPYERRTNFNNGIQNLALNFQCDRSTPTDSSAVDMQARFTVNIYTADGIENTIKVNAEPTATFQFSEDDTRNADGTLWVPPITSKSVGLGLIVRGPQTGPLQFNNPVETDGTQPGVNDR